MKWTIPATLFAFVLAFTACSGGPNAETRDDRAETTVKQSDEDRMLAALQRVGDILMENMDDPESALRGVESYLDENKKELTDTVARLREKLEEMPPDEAEAYQKDYSSRPEMNRYEAAFVRFMERHSDEHVTRLEDLLNPIQNAGADEAPVIGELIDADGPAMLELVQGSEADVILINFWASWCPPCKEEFPALLQTIQRFEDRSVHVILISLDEVPGDARDFLTQQGVAFDSYRLAGNPETFVYESQLSWRGALPTTLVLSAGKEDTVWEGPASAGIFENLLLQHLGEAP